MKAGFVCTALLLLATPAVAQVGHPPADSPYRDLEFRQELSVVAGYFFAAKDPAGVAPRSAPMLGARYEARVGGPAMLMVRAARVFSERRVIRPDTTAAFRDLGVRSWPLYLADVGLTLNLTGQKSFHHLVPVTSLGVGVASDLKSPDAGGFHMGTSFAFSLGGGVRWVPGGRFQVRADLTDHLYQIKYPPLYYRLASDSTQVLKNSQGRSVWKHNAAITVGASYLLFR